MRGIHAAREKNYFFAVSVAAALRSNIGRPTLIASFTTLAFEGLNGSIVKRVFTLVSKSPSIRYWKTGSFAVGLIILGRIKSERPIMHKNYFKKSAITIKRIRPRGINRAGENELNAITFSQMRPGTRRTGRFRGT